MKLFNIALFVVSLSFGATTPTWAGDAPQESYTHQSSFNNYKALSEDNLSDWTSINRPSNGGEHAGHSMAGMQHKMTPEEMANMATESHEMPAMEGMGHSKMPSMNKAAPDNMKGMDHSQMKQDPAMAPMAGMDHSKMAGMEMDT